jgi:hypothetical protein
MVLLNRAEANQYILVGNMKLGTGSSDTKYSTHIEESIGRELAMYRDRLKANSKLYDSISAQENKYQKMTMSSNGDTQLDQLTETQRLLAERLRAATDHYLLDQQEMLALARQQDMAAIKLTQDMAGNTDSSKTLQLLAAYQHVKSAAINDRYQAMDANRKFQLYNRYQALNYQEYIEMLRYKEHIKDTARKVSAAVLPAKSKPLATINASDTSDNLSGMDQEKRTALIRQAMEEEERFKNYEEKTTEENDLTVRDIHIASDDYEMQTDKKGNSKYFKNGKPVTKLTFDFETTRRMVDVLNTIHQVDKFGK